MMLRRLGGWTVLGGLLGAGCYGNVTLGGMPEDAGHDGMSGRDSGRDAGSRTDAASGKDAPSADDAASGKDAPSGKDARSETGSAYVDAGEYHGDGSFFVDAGRPDAPDGIDGSSDSGVDAPIGIDATPGCAPLAMCCGSLSGGSESLCESVAASGDATNCATELAELESGGDCMGVSVLASGVQVTPYTLVSDGTTLFWTTHQGVGLVAMAVGGGEIRTVLSGAGSPELIAVDDVNVYAYETAGLVRIPKNGAPATLVEVGAVAFGLPTTLGQNAYWLEQTSLRSCSLKSAPLAGGSVSTTAQSQCPPGVGSGALGVTTGAVFVGTYPVVYGSFSDSPDAGLTTIAGADCSFLASDTAAVYCSIDEAGSNLRVATDGTVTTLGTAVSSSYIVFDDTYAYWANGATAGTIVKAPKAGGGTATILAHDTSPAAIAVDAHSVYWSDQAGYIKSVPK